MGGKPDVMAIQAKSAEAFTIFERELQKERDHND
jgi:hypothetical protein